MNSQNETEFDWSEEVHSNLVTESKGEMDTQKIWDAGGRSVSAFLMMIQQHPGTGSSNRAAQLLDCMILDRGQFDLPKITSFDRWNLRHAVNIIHAVGLHKWQFREWVCKSYKREFEQLRNR